MGITRQAKESPQPQGEDEVVAYVVDTTNFPGTGAITNEVDEIKDSEGNDISTTNLTGAMSVSAPNITTRGVQLLVKGVRYRMEVKWDQNGNTYETYWFIDAEE